MSDLVSGGNIATGLSKSFWNLSTRGKISALLPFVLPLILIIAGSTDLIAVLQGHLSPLVTSTTSNLTARTVGNNTADNLSKASSYLSFGVTIFLIYLFMILPAFSTRLRVPPRLAFVVAFGVGIALLLPSIYLKPNAEVAAKVDTWGAQHLDISDLSDYTTVKDEVKQTFTLKNDAGKTITFAMESHSTADYDYTTYTTVTD